MENGASKLTTRRLSLTNGLMLKLLIFKLEMSSLRTGLLTKNPLPEIKLNSRLLLKLNGQNYGRLIRMLPSKPTKRSTDQSKTNLRLLSDKNHNL